MFPIRDHNPSGRTPWVTWLLIAANVGIFLAVWILSPSEAALGVVLDHWGLVPVEVIEGRGWSGLVTSMFLHAGWMHLIGNMLFLFIFGDNLEDVLGHAGFALFYLVSGLAAAAGQVAADPGSWMPIVGASGAIAGVMGGYLLLFPLAKVDVLFIIVIIFRILPIPAFLLLGLWFALQVFGGVATPSDAGGVAYWAHAGGFVAGAVLVLPVWLARGGPAFWRRTQGLPPHPGADLPRSAVPLVRRKRLPGITRRE